MSDAQPTAQGTRYYWCERCKKAVDNVQHYPGYRSVHYVKNGETYDTCGPVVVK